MQGKSTRKNQTRLSTVRKATSSSSNSAFERIWQGKLDSIQPSQMQV